MLGIAEKLLELSEMIGNGASVSIECRRREGLSPTMIFRVDWENDFHFRHELSFVRLAAQPNDILKIVAYHAQREYAQHGVNPT